MVANVARNGETPRFTNEEAIDQTDDRREGDRGDEDHEITSFEVALEHGCEHGHRRHERGDREVKAADEDDKGLSKDDHAQRRRHLSAD